MTAEQIARLRALADAYDEVTSGERVLISATESVPARLLRLGTTHLAGAAR